MMCWRYVDTWHGWEFGGVIVCVESWRKCDMPHCSTVGTFSTLTAVADASKLSYEKSRGKQMDAGWEKEENEGQAEKRRKLFDSRTLPIKIDQINLSTQEKLCRTHAIDWNTFVAVRVWSSLRLLVGVGASRGQGGQRRSDIWCCPTSLRMLCGCHLFHINQLGFMLIIYGNLCWFRSKLTEMRIKGKPSSRVTRRKLNASKRRGQVEWNGDEDA